MNTTMRYVFVVVFKLFFDPVCGSESENLKVFGLPILVDLCVLFSGLKPFSRGLIACGSVKLNFCGARWLRKTIHNGNKTIIVPKS